MQEKGIKSTPELSQKDDHRKVASPFKDLTLDDLKKKTNGDIKRNDIL